MTFMICIILARLVSNIRDIPEYRFQKIAIDLATNNGRKYPVCAGLCGLFCNFPLLDGFVNENSGDSIALLKKHFMRFGIPMEVVSDCGPQFDCVEFRAYCQAIWICMEPQ